MKIWFDVLTPKQLLFFEPMIGHLKKKHDVLCTSRKYDEVVNLAKIRKINLKILGKHGGGKKSDKLISSIKRMNQLFTIIKKFSPDITISCCSPEAARISFGLGINHIAFSDSPHASAVMKLSLSLVQKLLIPWIIPKKEFTKYGISSRNIVCYKAIDAASITKRIVSNNSKLPFSKNNRKTILLRIEEVQAAYSSKTNRTIKIVDSIVNEFPNENIVILGRYSQQIQNIKKKFGKSVQVLKMSFDGKLLLSKCDVFIGSGGTMTAESALLGVPTISYNAVPNLIQEYLVKKKLIHLENNPKKIVSTTKQLLESSNRENKKKARKIVNEMDNPLYLLIKIINSMN